jgi:hypothetical protein
VISILGFGCSTNAGRGAETLWQKLRAGEACPEFTWKRETTASDLLISELAFSWSEAKAMLSRETLGRIQDGARLGVILASTKGLLEDFIWSETPAGLERDPLTPLLEKTLERFELRPIEKASVSNACASSLAALTLAQMWIQRGRVDDVLILACDFAGPFVQKGFQNLRVLTPEITKPFSADRSGFHLGNGAAALFVSKFRDGEKAVIADSQVDSEGHAVSRPSHEGDSLFRACTGLRTLAANAIDLVMAHGTATQPNDVIEDRVFHRLFKDKNPPITNTKWCVGHTLGTSGLIDIIAGALVLQKQQAFTIASTRESDSTFSGRYLVGDASTELGSIENVLVTSLGFGGVHSAVHLAKTGLR